MNKYLRLVIVMVVVLGGMMFLLRHDPTMPMIVACVVFMVAAISWIFASPRAIAFISGHPKILISLGILFIVGPIFWMFVVAFAFPSIMPEENLMAGVFLASMMIGCLLITLPRSAKRAALSKSATIVLRSTSPETRDSFQGITEAYRSIQFVFGNWAAFLRIAGPWFFANALLPLMALQTIAFHDGITQSFFEPVVKPDDAAVVIAYLISALVFAVGFSTVSVAWHRYVLENRFPRTVVALPDRRVLRHMYRIWIFGIIMGVIDKTLRANAADISKQFGTATADVIIQAGSYFIWLLAIWFASAFALVLPAIAIDDREMIGQTSVIATKLWGASYRFGALVVFLPFLIAALALQKYLHAMFGTALTIQQLLALGSSFLVFAGVTAFATFLSRAYLAARAKINLPGASL